MRGLRARLGSILRFAPTPRLAWALAAASVLWLLPGRAGAVAGAAGLAGLAVFAAVDVVRLPPRRLLDVARTVPAAIGVGDRAPASYVVSSRWPRALTVEVYDRVPDAVAGGMGRGEVALVAGATATLPFEITGMSRGRAVLGDIGIRVRTSLGFMNVRYLVRTTDEVFVTPSVAGVRRFRLLALENRLDTAGVRALRRKGEGHSFAGLREYVLGDDPRAIDWKASARRAKLITREYTVERSQTVLTLIDAGRGMTQLAGGYTRFEQALSSALVLTDVAVAAGDYVGTLVFDDAVRAFVPALQSRGALRRIRDAFVPLEPTLREPDYAGAFRFLAAHQRKRALIVFFTDVIDARASQALVAHVTRSAARHLALVVALRNDAVFGAALLPTAGGAARIYESAAAEELILAREEALERMRRSGAVVLDVSPRVMTAGVVNRYLEIKRRGAL
ncbi:MAG: DUF58 domain-containing protein [Gemmatimonadaceae bacterium]